MISKSQIKYINSLKLKKNRQEQKLFIAEGVKIVDELLRSSFKIDSIYATEEWINQSLVISHQSSEKYKLTEVSDEELKRISSLETPNEVLAIVSIPEFDLKIESLSNELTLMLDDISDPGNMGTIIRIADWFGIKNIICTEDCVDVYNSKVVQATMGSMSRVKCHYVNSESFLYTLKEKMKTNENFRDYRIYGAILNSESVYMKELIDKGIIIIGNESKGISYEVSGYVTDRISIPPYPLYDEVNKAESLNASVATGIICAEFRRRSLFN